MNDLKALAEFHLDNIRQTHDKDGRFESALVTVGRLADTYQMVLVENRGLRQRIEVAAQMVMWPTAASYAVVLGEVWGGDFGSEAEVDALLEEHGTIGNAAAAGDPRLYTMLMADALNLVTEETFTASVTDKGHPGTFEPTPDLPDHPDSAIQAIILDRYRSGTNVAGSDQDKATARSFVRSLDFELTAKGHKIRFLEPHSILTSARAFAA